MGYVDLHLHLLPGVDDGARTLPDALEMARALVDLGYTRAAPSPHHRKEYAARDAAICEGKRHELQAALNDAKIPLELSTNAENFFLDETLLSDLGTPAARLLGKGKVMLVEAPYHGPLPMLPSFVFKMKLKGITPLIAHPERCMEFERDGRAAEVVRAGALLQLDLGAVIGRYGKPAEKLAREFLDEGLYAVAATDLHSPVNARGWVGDSLKTLEKLVGAQAFKSLVETRPGRLLEGVTE